MNWRDLSQTIPFLTRSVKDHTTPSPSPAGRFAACLLSDKWRRCSFFWLEPCSCISKRKAFLKVICSILSQQKRKFFGCWIQFIILSPSYVSMLFEGMSVSQNPCIHSCEDSTFCITHSVSCRAWEAGKRPGRPWQRPPESRALLGPRGASFKLPSQDRNYPPAHCNHEALDVMFIYPSTLGWLVSSLLN